MVRWIMTEAEKDPALIELCLTCKRRGCPGECDRYYALRDEVAGRLATAYAQKRIDDCHTAEASALRALLTAVCNGAGERVKARLHSREPLSIVDVQAVLQCTQSSARNICKLYGEYVGRKKYVTYITLDKLLTEVVKDEKGID